MEAISRFSQTLLYAFHDRDYHQLIIKIHEQIPALRAFHFLQMQSQDS